MNNPVVSIVIPNFNGKQLLKTCLKSITSQLFADYQVIIVDNGSTDGSVDFLKTHHPDIIIVAFQSNRGFSVAVNAGIKRSSGNYILLLNNDTELDPAFLSEIVEAFQSNPKIDFCAPKMLNFYNRTILDGVGDGFLRGGVNYRIGTLERDVDLFNTPRIVFGACAGAAVYKRDFFDKAGFFDEDFFAYLEDLDINLRAARLGLTCSYVPTARIFHMGSATTGSSFNLFTIRHTTKNIINVLIKNFTALELMFSLPRIVIHQLVWLLILAKRSQMKAYVQGIYLALISFPKMWAKRKLILTSKKLQRDSRFLRRVYSAEKEVIRSILRRRMSQDKSVRPIQIYMKLFYRA